MTRALVRSRAKLDYAGVQRQIDAGTAEEPLALLREIGRLREEQELARGGISLNVPEQEIVVRDGSYGLAYRAPLPAEGWNAQLSLLTGMAAAHLMAETGTGILRTLPIAPDGAVARLRRSAHALRIDWPHHVPYAEVVRSLDPRQGNHAAFLQECTTLLRGAGYTAFDHGDLPDPAVHAAVADLYTHCTAPLRRLVDLVRVRISAWRPPPGRNPLEWVREALPALPKEMAEGTRRANTVERACVDLVEAALLEGAGWASSSTRTWWTSRTGTPPSARSTSGCSRRPAPATCARPPARGAPALPPPAVPVFVRAGCAGRCGRCRPPRRSHRSRKGSESTRSSASRSTSPCAPGLLAHGISPAHRPLRMICCARSLFPTCTGRTERP
ncbi:hypothetical protein SMICM17S_05385 [Streptomyces microflavus]